MRARWAAGAVVAVLMTTGLAGCGESASSGAVEGPTGPPPSATTGDPTSEPTPTEESPTSDAPPSGEKGCPYLTAEQVSAVVGADTRETAGTVNACFFDPESGQGPSVMLSRVELQINPAEYARQSKVLCQGEVTDVEAGDEAFVCVMALGPQGQLYIGPVLVSVAVHDASDEATGIALAAALLPEVTVPSSSAG